jgi:hypothetical protein
MATRWPIGHESERVRSPTGVTLVPFGVACLTASVMVESWVGVQVLRGGAPSGGLGFRSGLTLVTYPEAVVLTSLFAT